MDIMKKPYEISLWEDQLVFVGESGASYADIIEAEEPIVSQYYKEIKVAVIGSNTMDSPARCVNPKLTEKVNGENSFSFVMYYQYWDNDEQKIVHNPFNKLLVNERKVKVRVGEPGEGCQWYDFIIKNVQENSETKAFTYTCKDQFVNELSKTGFELELANELENNMGTIDKLAEGILAGSDWELDYDTSSNLMQYKEEPLYRITLGKEITATDMLAKEETIIPANKDIYVFYSIVNDKKPQWQFLYTEDTFKTDDDLVIDKAEHSNYIIDVGTYEEWPDFVGLRADGAYLVEVSTNYRGERLVRQAQTKFDATIDKYVGVYQKDGKEYYGFTQSEYSTSAAVINYVANPSNFVDTSGWRTDNSQVDYNLKTQYNEENGYLSFLQINRKSGLVMNEGIGGHRSTIGSFVQGEKYALRMKYQTSLGTYKTSLPTIKISEYKLENGVYTMVKEPIFEFSKKSGKITTNDIDGNGNIVSLSNYVYAEATCSRSISKTQLTDWDFKIGLFLDFGSTKTVYIEDIQVFPYKEYTENGTTYLCIPGGKLFSEVKTKYVYYTPNEELKSISDLAPVYSDYKNDTSFEQVYSTDSKIKDTNEFTKVRSISGKESNRFNLLQSLCETFECWMKLRIERDKTNGEIKLDENHRQQKFISFHEFVGKDNPIGFRYGINSKSISRTIDSSSIVSKMVVKDNANEFAPNGFCSIARASESPTGENFLLSFDHYVRQRLLSFNVITNDLYIDSNGYLGYYKQLKALNVQRDEKIDIQAGLLVDISNYEAAYTTYKTSYDKASEEILLIENEISELTGEKFSTDIIQSYLNNRLDADDKVNSYCAKWCQCKNVLDQHKPLFEKAQLNLKNAKKQYDEIEVDLKTLADNKRALNLQFYKKYSRFIQEGSWIKEDYTDPNLYYLDAESTLHTSTQPKVSYNISVINVELLSVQKEYEDFKYYKFNIGDKTYVEDVEFFGWSLKPNRAPYREEVVVSEIITELDSPEKNQIKVQNYKTQFEDLFQRITANTQQAEYHTGEYNRVASVVESNGLISADTLQNSFVNNAFKLSNARDQSVVWDESGITTTSLRNPSEMVRIISGGIFLSTDGGQNWKTGITGSGINTSYLTAGQINTNEIYIRSGDFPTFLWDTRGINAYSFELVDDTPTDFNTSKFVRYDQYGLYGINGLKDFRPTNEEDVWDNASFALTWSGFSLKNNDGSVRITSDEDIQVLSGETERIKIGRIDSNKYGIRISNGEGAPVMETGDDGRLWLKEKMFIETANNKTVAIGKLGSGEVINANNDFIVYEDGRICANGGTIGGMEIASFVSDYEVQVVSSGGNMFKNGQGEVVLTAELYKGKVKIESTQLLYQWIKNGVNISGENSQTLVVRAADLGSDSATYECIITFKS